MSQPDSVVLAGSERLILEAVAQLINGHFRPVAIVSGLADLTRALDVHKPELLIVDARSGGWSLPNLVGCLRQQRTAPETVALVREANIDLEAATGLRIRVLGTRAGIADLFRTLYGNTQAISGDGLAISLVERLTPRQTEILRLLAVEKSTKDIASALGISPRTVEFHKYRIMRTLQVNSMPQLVRWIVESGLTDEEPTGIAMVG
jgi:DNA-binding NarL/FixJ family response regulator